MRKEALVAVIVVLAVAGVAAAVVFMNPRGKISADDLRKRNAGMNRLLREMEKVNKRLLVLQDQLERLEERFNELDDRQGRLETQQRRLAKRMGEFEKRLSSAGKLAALPSKDKQGQPLPLPQDFSNMTPEQQKAFERLVGRTMFSLGMKYAQRFKNQFLKSAYDRVDKFYAEKLDLTEMQKEDIKRILKDQADKGLKRMLELFQQGRLQDMRVEGRKLMEETYEEIKKVLEPDQIEKWKEIDKQFKRYEERLKKQQQKPPSPQ